MWWAKALANTRVLVPNPIPLLTVLFPARTSLIAENLFLREQLAYYREHKLKPQPLTDAARWTLVLCSRLFEWRSTLVMFKPDTLIGWNPVSYLCRRRESRPEELQDIVTFEEAIKWPTHRPRSKPFRGFDEYTAADLQRRGIADTLALVFGRHLC